MREVADLSEILSSNEISELEQNKKRIVRLEKDFNIFDLFRTIFDENAWTKYFAFLLDSTEKHGLGLKVFTYWSNKIADDKSIFKKFLTTIKDDIISVHSKTEWSTSEGRRVDLLLELFNASNKLIAIIGLENKVDSGEQENQVSDYQKSITFIYPSVPKIILFCTPQGKKSTTAQKYYKECPYLSVDYSYFQKVCQKFSGITIGEINILFNSMDRYLEIMLKKRRNLAILSKTYSKAEPFQKRNRYSPAVPFLNDFIKYALKDDNKSRIPFKFEYKTFSTNEIDFFDRSLGKQNYLIPCYMLNSKKKSSNRRLFCG